MKRRSAYFLSTGVFVIALAAAWLALSPTNRVKVAQVEVVDDGGTGILDGMTFAGSMRLASESQGVDDTFVFANGTFASTECDRRCGYPARPYFIRHVDGKIEFISESHCLYKDAKIEWRGTVEDGTIKGESIWTVDRWYWTIEKEFLFEGTLVDTAAPAASSS